MMKAPEFDEQPTSLVKPGGVGSFAIDPTFGLKQKIKVAVRLRPPLDDGDNSKGKKGKNADKRAWNVSKDGAFDSLIQKGTARKVEGRTLFNFDQVFAEDIKTPLVYKAIARPMVHSVLEGKHATIFAYGQTGSGKTFTMQGDGQKQSGQAGIIQLVASDMFRFMRQGTKRNREFIVKCSYVEVYNERIRDLLSEDNGSNVSHGTPEAQTKGGAEVQVRVDGMGGVVLGCVQEEVTTVDEVLELLIQGNTQRIVAKTDMNTHSSRSHAVFRLTVESREKGVNPGISDEVLRVADFNLVDLAGSESLKVSNTNGLRFREGVKINLSLLCLSTVIHSLSLPEKKRPKQVNYQDSKLTSMLEPHLSGNAEMAIVCCITPSKAFLEETRSTLKFGAQAKLVDVKPKINEAVDDAAFIKKLQHELSNAKKRIAELERELEEARGESYPEQRPPIQPYGAQNTVEDEEPVSDGDGDNVDYGYEDMATMENNRQYVMPANQDVPEEMERDFGAPPKPSSGARQYVMPASQEVPAEMERDFGAPSGGGRAYVMPANQDVPEGMDRVFGNRKDPPPSSGRQYVMPAAMDVPEDMNRDFGMNGNRQYVMPDDFDEDLKDQVREDNGTRSSMFSLDSVDEPYDPYASHMAAHQKRQGGMQMEDDESVELLNASVDSEEFGMSALERLNYRAQKEERKMSAPHQLDFPVPGQGDSSRPQEYPMPGYLPEKKAGDSFGTPSRHETTLPTEDESLDGPEASYADISYKYGSVVSTPDTLRGASEAGRGTRYEGLDTLEEIDPILERANKVSWDTLDLNAMQPDQVGKPLKAMQSLYNRDTPMPEEITIMHISVGEGDEMCLTDKLHDAEARAAFLEGKLEMSDDLVEAVFKDLERARLCIHDMVFRNVQLSAKLKDKKREDIKEEYQEGEVVVEQYWLLKGCMYTGLFFFVAGGGEFFMATVFLVWLILEANLTA